MTLVQLREPRVSWVDSTKPGEEFASTGSVAKPRVQSGSAETFLAWGLPGDLRKGAYVQRNDLQIVLDAATTGTHNYTVRRAAARWRNRSLNWTTRPGVAGPAAVTISVPPSPAGTVLTFPMAAEMQDWVDSGGGVHPGYRLTTADTTRRRLRALPGAVMVLEWSTTPAAPTDLAPAGGAVSVSHPLLRFSASDVIAVQVAVDPDLSVDANGAPVSPDFDSGEVTTSVPALALAETAFAGIPTDETVDWTVRTKSTSGTWSPWAKPATVARIAKPTPSILTTFAYDSQPLLDGDMTGMTAAQWLIARADSPSVVLYDSKILDTTTGQHTPTSRVLTEQGPLYRLTLRAWDDVDRVSGGPDDPAYMEASADIALDYSLVTAGPDQVTVEQVGNTPALRVVITEDSPGDAYTFELASGWSERVDVADLEPDGTNRYARTLWAVPPNRPDQLRVRPHADDETGTGRVNDISVRVRLKWLVDPATGKYLAIADESDEGLTYSSPESESLYRSSGSEYVVRHRTRRAKPEGVVSGVLIDTDYGSASDMLAIAEEWADPRLTPADRPFRLIMGHVNHLVWIGNLELRPSSWTRPGHLVVPVSCSWWTARPQDR